MYEYKKRIWSLPFFNNIKKQTSEYISGLLDENKGCCWDFTPVIFVNGDCKTSLYSRVLFDDLGIDDYSQAEIKRHEFFHYFSLVGSSLGSLYHHLSCLKIALSESLLKRLSEAKLNQKIKPPFFLTEPKINCPDPFEHNIELMLLKDIYTVRTLFYFAGNHALRDYILSLLNIIESGTFTQFPKLEDKDKNTFKLDLTFSQEIFPDLVGFAAHGYPENAPEHHHETKSLLVSVKDILEAYARTCEMIEGQIVASKAKEYREAVRQFANHALKNEYVTALNILNLHLSPGKGKLNVPDFFATSLFILELSLMTTFHPALLPNSPSPDWAEEFLIPQRFLNLCAYFKRNNKSLSIEDLYDNKKMISLMDDICEKLGWMKYSESLDKLFDYYTNENIIAQKDYILSALIVLDFKKKQSVFPITWRECFPVIIYYDDKIEPTIKEFLNPERFDVNKIILDMENNLVFNVFTDQFLLCENYDFLKKVLKKIHPQNPIDSTKLKNELLLKFLIKNGLNNFIDPL